MLVSELIHLKHRYHGNKSNKTIHLRTDAFRIEHIYL